MCADPNLISHQTHHVLSMGFSPKLRVVSFGAPQKRKKLWDELSPLPELSCVGREGAVPGLGVTSPCPGCSTGIKVVLFSNAITQPSETTWQQITAIVKSALKGPILVPRWRKDILEQAQLINRGRTTASGIIL